MTHFSAELWFDFARGIASPEQNVLMHHHLEGQCGKCSTELDMWNRVLEVARREGEYSPPASAVRIAKAAYASADRWTWLPRIARMARLIFDSARQPGAAPVRGSMPHTRQFLHRAEPFVIDLRVESEPARKHVWLTGQVLNSKRPGTNVEGVDVILLSEERFIAKTLANPSGEFELEFGDERGLQLFINIHGQRAIGITLPDPES
ncbi:MAG: hypothetical protein JOY62_05420 [Acidobacteriaceae bacterium]|nr:hypothetical protein [Acidobacteriaceae bacterium]MBV9779396.1 hypothetical protein [Acidobacteriaceae bacterium]